MVNGLIIFALLVTSNVLLTNGFGVLSLQRSKNNQGFTLLNCMYVSLTILASSSLYSFIFKFLTRFGLGNLGILVMVALCGAFGFASLQFVKWVSKEMYYYYDTTYSFVVNLGTSIGILLCIDFSGSIGASICYGALAALGYTIVSILFSLNYHRLANQKISRRVRPVPITILTVAVLCMILYAIGVSI